jgi:hypothetical protein
MKFNSDFIGPQIFIFKRSLSLSPGPQSSLVPHCKNSFGGTGYMGTDTLDKGKTDEIIKKFN